MKLAILSDIHGNDIALEAVIQDITRFQVDRILILGDLITDFFEMTRSVLDRIRSMNAIVIKGNREGYLLKNARGEYGDEWQHYKQFFPLLKTYQRLGIEDLNFIKSLPEQISIRYDDKFSVRMVHGSPFSELDGILEEDDDLIRRSADAIEESVLLCGHTHCPMMKKTGAKTIVNPGSVGINLAGDCVAQYAMIEYKNGEISVEMRKVLYDIKQLKAACRSTDEWTRFCLKTIEDGRDYSMEFLQAAKAYCDVWPIPDGVWDLLYEKWLVDNR